MAIPTITFPSLEKIEPFLNEWFKTELDTSSQREKMQEVFRSVAGNFSDKTMSSADIDGLVAVAGLDLGAIVNLEDTKPFERSLKQALLDCVAQKVASVAREDYRKQQYL